MNRQVLHLLAMARAAEVELTMDDFQAVADKAPFLANLKYVAARIDKNLLRTRNPDLQEST